MFSADKMNAVSVVLLWFLICGLQGFAEGFNNNTTATTTTPTIDVLLSVEKDDGNSPTSEDIRCFCNLPQCVSTSYMCRTARSGNGSGCFSEIRESSDSVPTRHGCVELLRNLDRQVQCDNTPRKHNINILSKSDMSTEMLLLCCQKDMCNHVDIPKAEEDSNILEHSDLTIPGLLQSINGEISNQLNLPIQPPPGKSNNDDWFRVATIAVPICGAVILFSLIATAIKILRSERMTSSSLKLDSPNEFSRKFRLDHEAQSIKRSPHLIRICGNNQSSSPMTAACDKKNETRAKINQLINIEYSLLPQSCTDSLVKANNLEASSNLNKNINISLGPSCKNKDNFSKIYDKEVLSPITVDWSGDSSKSLNM